MKDHEIAQLVNRLTVIARDFGHAQQLRERIAQEIRPLASQRTEQQANPWRQAVDEALIAHALDCTGPGDDPKEKVKELIEWAVTIATDHRVAEQAMNHITDEQIAAAVRPLYADDTAASMGLADDIRTVRAVLALQPSASAEPAQEPKVDVEQMLRDCVPGGSSCDPQAICDDIRNWFANGEKNV